MNTNPFNTNVSESHTAHACIRTVAEKNSELLRDRYNPHAITAITPDACAASATKYTTYGTTMLTVISIGPSFSRRSNHSTTSPINSPIAIPARIKYVNRKNPCATVVESTAPNTSPSRQSNPLNTHGAANATPTAVNPTSPTASMKMRTKFLRKSRHDVCQAPLYNNGGNTTRNTTSGFN